MTSKKTSLSSTSVPAFDQPTQMLNRLLEIQRNLRAALEMVDEVIAVAQALDREMEEIALDLEKIVQRAGGRARGKNEITRIELPSSIREEPPPFAKDTPSELGDDGGSDDNQDLVPIL